jgi:hypothetical protein
MQGLVSRETLCSEAEDSDEDTGSDEDSDRECKRPNPGDLAFVYAASPFSPIDPDSEADQHSEDEPLAAENGSRSYVSQLEEENKALRERVEILEGLLRQRDVGRND